MAMRPYIEKAIEIMGGLPEGLEIYRVSGPRVVTQAHIDQLTSHGPDGVSRSDFVCWQCGNWFHPGERFRFIAIRKAGTSWTDRTYRYVHVDCFRGNRPKRRSA